MFNFHEIMNAFTAQLNASIDVSNITEAVSGEYVNEDVNEAPWLGVYRGKVSYEPRTLGYKSFEATLVIKVIAQASSIDNAPDCEQALEDLVQKTINAITSDTSIAGTVDMLNSFEVDYGFIETERDSMYFQSAIISFELEVDAR